MHVLINIKSPNNISKWHMEFNSAFKVLMEIKIHRELNNYDVIELTPGVLVINW
jgi:hypothetical protein